jgi:hypothetical protein
LSIGSKNLLSEQVTPRNRQFGGIKAALARNSANRRNLVRNQGPQQFLLVPILGT